MNDNTSDESASRVELSSLQEQEDYGTLSIPLTTLPVGYTTKPSLSFSKPEKAEKLDYVVYKESVISIEEDGTITSLRQGQTQVQAFSEHFECTFTVNVIADPFSAKVSRRLSTYDTEKYVAEGRTLFAGDSFLDTDEFFTNFSTFYGDKNVFSMGISATTADDWYFYSQKLIIPYAPENVVFHIGTNDINDDKCSANQAYKRLVNLFESIHEVLPSTHIYIMGIEPSISFAQNLDMELETNEKTKKYCEDNASWMTYLDTPSLFSNEDGTAKGEMLRDGLHPKLENYHLIVDKIAEKLTISDL